MKKKIVSVMLSVAMAATLAVGCGGNNGAADTSSASSTDTSSASSTDTSSTTTTDTTASTDTTEATTDATGDDAGAAGLAYTGTINLMHYSTSEEAQGNGSSEGMRSCIAAWEAANPGITLEQTVLSNDDYKQQIATKAAADDLPDVFLLQGMNTISWSKQGLLYDLTDTINNSEYAANYNYDLLTPFTAGGKYYAMPTVSGGTCTVVMYDSQMWADAGYSEFPKTWDEVQQAAAYFKDQDIDAVAFGNGGQWQMNSCFLSCLAYQYTGTEWYDKIIACDGSAKFDDPSFIAALTETQRLFKDSGIFNSDFNSVTNEDAREYFIAGDAAAFIGGNWDYSYVASSLEANNPDKLANMKIAVLPEGENATSYEPMQNGGFGFGVAISAKAAEDPDKLAACIDLAKFLSGPVFADFVGANYGLGGFYKSDFSTDALKQYDIDLYNFTYKDTKSVAIYDSFLGGDVWSTLNAGMQEMTAGNKTPEDLAAETQAAYEAFCAQ